MCLNVETAKCETELAFLTLSQYTVRNASAYIYKSLYEDGPNKCGNFIFAMRGLGCLQLGSRDCHVHNHSFSRGVHGAQSIGLPPRLKAYLEEQNAKSRDVCRNRAQVMDWSQSRGGRNTASKDDHERLLGSTGIGTVLDAFFPYAWIFEPVFLFFFLLHLETCKSVIIYNFVNTWWFCRYIFKKSSSAQNNPRPFTMI